MVFPMIIVNGDKMDWEKGMTVRKVLHKRKWTYPLIAVWINEIPVNPDDFGITDIPDDATVQVVHMIAGG